MNKYQLFIRLIGVISVIVSEAVQMQIILQTKLILQLVTEFRGAASLNCRSVSIRNVLSEKVVKKKITWSN